MAERNHEGLAVWAESLKMATESFRAFCALASFREGHGQSTWGTRQACPTIGGCQFTEANVRDIQRHQDCCCGQAAGNFPRNSPPRATHTRSARRVADELGYSASMHIRAFTPEDETAVIQLWKDCGLTRPWNHPGKDVSRKLSEQPELFLVGILDGRLVASAMFGYDGHRGSVYYLAVAPGNRRLSLGRQIMQAGEALLLQRGCPKVNLLVRNSNAEVIEFYRRLGYVVDPVASLGKRLIED
jgi:ribosomal protein S18 acetylase RimI-like enzyme